jgi:hypothetical protein
VKAKNGPRLVAAARELKDRWLEELASGRYLPGGNGKYEVGRSLEAGRGDGGRLGGRIVAAIPAAKAA